MPALAFGPGLNVEGALFRACDGPKQSGQGMKAAAAAAATEDVQGSGREERKDASKEERPGKKQLHREAAIDLDMRNNTGLL